jgi:crossover junction endodeoxyribonuclease RusA
VAVMWAVTVKGTPVPKPSPVCYGIGGKHQLRLPKGSPGYTAWRERCVAAGQRLHQLAGDTLTGAVSMEVEFRLPRPAGHYGTGSNAHDVKASAPVLPIVRRGDIDKLERLLLDACTDAALWVDDAQVVDLNTSKRYAPQNEAGATIRVWRTPNEL